MASKPSSRSPCQGLVLCFGVNTQNKANPGLWCKSWRDLHDLRLHIGNIRLQIDEHFYEQQCDSGFFVELRHLKRFSVMEHDSSKGLPDFTISEYLDVGD
eukprot:TRINITY_DN18540_c1_g1_i1.p1 TRINITY_DN18540_c1_g1~~TRINITY_DN18540_c1_g1_i1.p1  ORF type:complete len:100 (-),score=11.44 TRINITY_DN18540_c1_g1_i1:142-441(-)